MLMLALVLSYLAQPTIEVNLSQLAPEASSAIVAQQAKSTTSASQWLTLAMLYHANGLEDAAIQAYEYSLELSDYPKAKYLLGIALARTGEYEKAIEVVEQISGYTPAIWRRGYWHMDLGQPEKAISFFQRAIEEDPMCVSAMIGLARVYLATNKPDKAIALLDSIVARGGTHPYVTFLLGTAHRRAGNHAVATKLLAEKTIGPPRWPDPWLEEMQTHSKGYAADFKRATTLIDKGNPAAARSILESLQKRYPKDSAVLNNLATVYLELRNIKLAEETLKKSMRLSPTYAPSQLSMAYVMQAKGDIDLGLAYANKAIQLQPSMSEAHALVGELSFQKGAMPDAIKHFSKAIELGNSNPNLREMFGMVLLNSGRPNDALRQFELVLQATPESPVSISGQCVSIALLGNPDKALQILGEAKIKFPGDSRIANAWQSVLRIKGRK